MSESIVIVGAARTPMGGFQGDFSSSRRTTSAAPPSRPPSSAPASRPTASAKCCSATA